MLMSLLDSSVKCVALRQQDGTDKFSGNAKTYVKEILYVGDFKPSNGDKFSIDEKTIDNMVAQTNAMIAAGHKVPVPVVNENGEHTFDPLANKGFVSKLSKDTDHKGRVGLFATLEFDSEETAKQAILSDVSIYSVAELERNGVTYKWPIMHVALTSYPQVPDLGTFTIAASIPIGENDMALKDALIKALSLELKDDADEAAIVAAISAKLTPPKKVESKPKKTGDVAMSQAMKSRLLASEKDRRESKIMSLVENKGGPLISTATAKELVDSYCSEQSLELSMKLKSASDDFDSVIAALAKNTPIVSTTETSGPQVLTLAGDDLTDPKKNPMALAADRICERHENEMKLIRS